MLQDSLETTGMQMWNKQRGKAVHYWLAMLNQSGGLGR